MSDKGKLEALAAMIAAEIKGAPQKPKLRLITREDFEPPAQAGIDPITRAYMCDRVRDLARMYWLGWLVRQETRGAPLECLDDNELSSLLAKMERGRECRVDGLGFDEAGLVRDHQGWGLP